MEELFRLIDSEPIRVIETKIVDVWEQLVSAYEDLEARNCRPLLEVRKEMIDNWTMERFDAIRSEAEGFNEALKDAICRLHAKASNIYKVQTEEHDDKYDVVVEANLFFPKEYPKRHYLQYERPRDGDRFWHILCKPDWQPYYEDGIIGGGIRFTSEEQRPVEEYLQVGHVIGNNSEPLDKMPIVEAFSRLYVFSNFALTDFVFIREFREDITIKLKTK